MKIKLTSSSSACGFILLLVMVLCAASLVVLAGVMSYTNTTANINQRNNQVAMCRNAAEAATEKVYSKMAYDFTAYGLGQVSNNMVAGIYKAIVPTTNDNAFFGNFNFSDATSNNYTYIGFLTNYTGPMPSQYTNSYVATSPIYRIVSNVTMPGTRFNTIVGTAQEDLLLALVPITTYAIFYNGEIEFTGCATMTINGRTHSNADICVGTSASCTFNAPVTCCSVIQMPQRASWGPYTTSTAHTTYNAGSSTNVVSVAISIPMTNTHSIIELPPAGELTTSVLGLQREYNKANVCIIVTNSPSGGTNPAVYITLQNSYNGNAPVLDINAKSYYYTNVTTTFLQTNWSCITNYAATAFGPSNALGSIALPFLSLTNTFYDQRESKTNLVTQIDVGAFASWALTNIVCSNKFVLSGNYPSILYVADRRNVNSKQMAVVRVVNGQQLPYNNGIGFSVATLNPIYLKGNYNTTIDKGVHQALAIYSTTNVFTATNGVTMTYTVPAALIADSITILSTNWQDSQSTSSYTVTQNPADMTMNAAIIVGNVPSTGTGATQFSGGVHNLTRMLEDWANYTLTYNTSIVCLYASQTATNQYVPAGSAGAYYSAPTRNWGFDQTYYNPGKQPPGVPAALVPIRFNWTIPPPGSITSN